MRNERWNAHRCFQAAASLEATTRALLDAAKDLESAVDAPGREAALALKQAQAQLADARRALQAAGSGRAALHVVIGPSPE